MRKKEMNWTNDRACQVCQVSKTHIPFTIHNHRNHRNQPCFPACRSSPWTCLEEHPSWYPGAEILQRKHPPSHISPYLASTSLDLSNLVQKFVKHSKAYIPQEFEEIWRFEKHLVISYVMSNFQNYRNDSLHRSSAAQGTVAFHLRWPYFRPILFDCCYYTTATRILLLPKKRCKTENENNVEIPHGHIASD